MLPWHCMDTALLTFYNISQKIKYKKFIGPVA